MFTEYGEITEIGERVGGELIFRNALSQLVLEVKLELADKKKIDEQFEDYGKLAYLYFAEKQRSLTAEEIAQRHCLLEKYEMPTSSCAQVMYKIVSSLNEKHNLCHSEEQKWLNLQVEFRQYRFLNDFEIKKLQSLEHKASNVGDQETAEAVQKALLMLENEEKELEKLIESLQPKKAGETDFSNSITELTKRVADLAGAYGSRGRTHILNKYSGSELDKSVEKKTSFTSSIPKKIRREEWER